MPIFTTLIQVTALMLLGLVAGSMFGIWRGYDLAQYTPQAFVEVHQGAVRGLNVLLPAMALGTLVLVVILAVFARDRGAVLSLYIIAALGIVAAGLVTRFLNQPINAEIMNWSAASLPSNWQSIRDNWWNWHQLRLAVAIGTELVLIAAVSPLKTPY